jgi:hypothetical protein
MSQYKEFLNANRDKLTPVQKRMLEGLHREGLQVNGLIRHLKGELNARPELPRTLNAENLVETASAFRDYFVRARKALAAMPAALAAKKEYREKTFAVTSAICSDIKHRKVVTTPKVEKKDNVTVITGNNMVDNLIAAAKNGEPWAKAIIDVAKDFAEEFPKEKKPVANDPTELARITPKKIAVLKKGTFSADRKAAVELFNKLHEALADKNWVEHPENRILVDFRSV